MMHMTDHASKAWLHPRRDTWVDALVVIGVIMMVAALAVV